VACSGAKLKDILQDGSETGYNQFSKQSQGKESSAFDPEIYGNFLAGYRPQINFVKKINRGS
jgi:hypothetical protein